MPDPASVPDRASTLDADERFAIIPEWVLYSAISDRAVRLYCVLGRYADKGTGVAYPSRARLALRLGCSKESVDRAVRELAAAGAVVATRRFNEDTRTYDSTHYRVMRSSPVTTGSPTGATTPSRVADEGVAAPVTTERESENESQLEREKDTADFVAFWSAYPRHTDKGGARKAWAKAIKRAAPDAVIAGAQRFAADPNLPVAKFIPHPSTWLNGDRWEDEALPSQTGAQRPANAAPKWDRSQPSGAVDRSQL